MSSLSDDIIDKAISTIRGCGIDLDSIDTLYVVEGVLINEAPLRVGKGAGGLGEVDLPVIKLPDGRPYIPGSSIKGALRSTAEALVRSSGGRACEPDPKGSEFNKCTLGAELLTTLYYLLLTRNHDVLEDKEKLLRFIESRVLRKYSSSVNIEEVKNVLEGELDKGDIEGLVKAIGEKFGPCIICQIFGNTSLASHVEILDAVPETNDLRILTRTRVAIDRFRGAARSGALFDFEYVPPGVRWRFKLIIKNIDLRKDGSKQRLLKQLLKLLSLDVPGIPVGGMKSVGLGRIRLLGSETTVTGFKVRDFELRETSRSKLEEVLE